MSERRAGQQRGVDGRGAVVVTGSSSGIGAACVELLARSGFAVFAGRRDVREAGVAGVVRSGTLVSVSLDVTDDASVALAREEIERRLGPDGRLAGLVNNAGTVVIGPAELLSMDDLRRQYEVNVVGAVRTSRAFLPLLRHSGGRIVNMGSLTARMSFPFAGPYSSSKAALAAMSHAMRRELRPQGVHVAFLEPGNIKTEIWDKHIRSVETLLGRADPEARRAYEGGLLADVEMVRRLRGAGADPSVVARAVLRALEAEKPRGRYPVGADAIALSALLKFLPSPLTDRLVARFMGLQ